MGWLCELVGRSSVGPVAAAIAVAVVDKKAGRQACEGSA